MNKILKNKKALSTVVTTLIILVVSVLLATVLTFYAINVTTNRSQQESLYMANLHVWYCNYTGQPAFTLAAVSVINTGGRDVVIQSITARSQPVTWSNVYYYENNTITVNGLIPINTTWSKNPATVKNSTSDLNRDVSFTGAAAPVDLVQAKSVVTLKSGYTLILYICHPDSVGMDDVGTPIAVTVFTANAQWTQEANVQASP